MWEIESGTCLRTLEGHDELVRCIRFDNKRIVSGAYDGKIKVWDLNAALDPESNESSLCLKTLCEHTGRVFRLQFDEFQIVSSSHDDSILIWDFLGGEPPVQNKRNPNSRLGNSNGKSGNANHIPNQSNQNNAASQSGSQSNNNQNQNPSSSHNNVNGNSGSGVRNNDNHLGLGAAVEAVADVAAAPINASVNFGQLGSAPWFALNEPNRPTFSNSFHQSRSSDHSRPQNRSSPSQTGFGRISDHEMANTENQARPMSSFNHLSPMFKLEQQPDEELMDTCSGSGSNEPIASAEPYTVANFEHLFAGTSPTDSPPSDESNPPTSNSVCLGVCSNLYNIPPNHHLTNNHHQASCNIACNCK